MSVCFGSIGSRSLFGSHVVVPKYKKQKTRKQFLYQSTKLWNKFVGRIFELPHIDKKLNIIIPGSCKNSDFSAPVNFVKQKFKNILMEIQNYGNYQNWEAYNFDMKK